VASLQPSATVTLRDLGLLDRLVACTKYCADVCPEVANGSRLIVSDSWTAQTEQILAARPDLVLASVPVSYTHLDVYKRQMQGRTTIFISHRVSTVRNADRIAVLHDGQIVEYGTHEELIERNGYYTELYNKQLLEEELETETV